VSNLTFAIDGFFLFQVQFQTSNQPTLQGWFKILNELYFSRSTLKKKTSKQKISSKKNPSFDVA